MFFAAILQGFTVAILIGTGVEQAEVRGPQNALEKEGAVVHMISPEKGSVRAWDCYALKPQDEIRVDLTCDKANPTDYDALVIPGGLNNDDQRIDESVLKFVRAFTKKPIASICHGQMILINAKLVRGRKLTSYPSIRIDLENAGANWIDKEVVIDRNLLTSRNRNDVPAFSKALVVHFANGLPK